VRPLEGQARHYEVVAGHRRYKALREIHRNDGDPKIPCILCQLDAVRADAVSLGENFAREALHPLDEAEAFGKLADNQAKGMERVAAEFGVSEHYVRQRLRLATLAPTVKTAYRNSQINTATAEAFASVPQEKQTEVWAELNGSPRNAEQVRSVIAHDWIDAGHALFDVSALPQGTVSRDLFSEQVLVERKAFMAAQIQAISQERQAMLEAGWSHVEAGRSQEMNPPVGMEIPEREFDEETTARLQKIALRRDKLESKLEEIQEEDEPALGIAQEKLEMLDAEERQVIENAPVYVSQATKAVATAYLILYPDGQVRREHRVPRRRASQQVDGNGHATEGFADDGTPPTSDDLGEKQLATTFTHQALAVREALLNDPRLGRRIMAMILHEKIRSDALAVRHEPNATTLYASNEEGFTSSSRDRLTAKRQKLDPFAHTPGVSDVEAYERLSKLSASKLDALIDLLVVECVTAQLRRPTELVQRLAEELKVNLRAHWRPDAAWLGGFQKLQLSHLMVELKGQVFAPAPDRKKSELVEDLTQLFTDAAEGKLQDQQLAEKVNRWLPSNLRQPNSAANNT
jgi:ParB family chromosome partitioning protein